MTDGGWAASAGAWIADQGVDGDWSRRHVLDAPMRERLRRRPYRRALDVGCGEGRFCRVMQQEGIATVGIDPTTALLDRARELDPTGDYRASTAETLDVPPGSFDLVVSYLTLIDIPDLPTALDRMVDALAPGGRLLIANLNAFSTAAMPGGWLRDAAGEPRFGFDGYLEERAVWVEWAGLRVQNWHRPLSTYLSALLERGLVLRQFAEPAPGSGDPAIAARYRRAPWFHIMEWAKPG